MKTRIIYDFSELEKIQSAWENLSRQHPSPEIFQTFNWARVAWQAFGPSRELCTPVVYRDEEIIGIIPLVKKENTIRFLGVPRSDYNDILSSEENGATVIRAGLEALLDSSVSWKRAFFENISENSLLKKFWDRVSHRVKRNLLLRFKVICPTVIFTPEDREELFRDILNKKSLKRHTKKLSKMGQLTFRHLKTREEIRKHMPRFFEQHIQRRGKAGDESLFVRESNKRFYYSLIDEFDPARELRFAVLSLDDEPLAYHFGFEYQHKFVWYKPAFNVDYWKFSPGEVLIRHLFEYCSTRDVWEFDFTVGDEFFKHRFANRIKNNYTLYFFKNPWKKMLTDFELYLKKQFRPLLKKLRGK